MVQVEASLVQICVVSTEPTARLRSRTLTTMKLLVLMWLLLQPSSTPLKEKSLAYSRNMPTFGRDHSFIHQVNLNGFRPMFMKHLSKLVVPNLSILCMDILSLFSSRMVWPMPPPLEDPQIRTWTHIHMSSSHLLINGTTVKSLTNPLVTPCLMLMVISISPSLPTSTPSWMHLQEIVGHTQKSLLFSQPISIRVHPKSLTGILNAHFLHGHPHPASRTLLMSPPGMELLHTPRITLKSTLSLAILFSASPDAVRLLQQTPSSLTLLLLMMVRAWTNSSVVMILLSVMHMASNQPNNSSTPSLITSENGESMNTLTSDGGKYEISKGVTDLLHSLFIEDYQSESYHQDQNKTENCFGPAKRYTNTVMNTSGCLACCWLLCLQYICVVLHHLASPTLQGICPVQALQGTTPDISFMLHSSFYEPVYYRIDSSEPDFHFPSSSNGKEGYWVGFADNQGDCLTWRILTENTQKIIICSGVRSALRTTTTSVLHHLQGREPHFLFPFLTHNTLKILCHLIPLMNPHPILSNLSTVSLVKMKIIQSTWPTLTFPIFLADLSSTT